MLGLISAALNRLYPTSVSMYVFRSTRQSNGPHWLSISQLSCPGLRRWRKASLGSRRSVFSFRETPIAVLFSLPTSPVSGRTRPSPHNRKPEPQVEGQVLLKWFLFIYFLSHTDSHHCHCVGAQWCFLGFFLLWRILPPHTFLICLPIFKNLGERSRVLWPPEKILLFIQKAKTCAEGGINTSHRGRRNE